MTEKELNQIKEAVKQACDQVIDDKLDKFSKEIQSQFVITNQLIDKIIEDLNSNKMEIKYDSKKQKFIKSRISEIKYQIEKLSSEMMDLQNECQHPIARECDYSWRPGRIDKVNVCNTCNKIISDSFVF